mgnify:CR=1 FL=1
MKAASLLLILSFPLAAHADIVELTWTGGAFSHRAKIAPKKFLEVCGKLKAGDGVAWKFSGTVPTDFNIHYHVGKDVTYPENRKDIADAGGTLAAPLDQDYCWMWTNRSAQAVDIDINLSQTKPAR